MLTFRRLLGFLRPYRKGVAWSFVLAAGAMGATVLIPYLTGRAIDGIRGHDRSALTWWAVAVAVAGLLRLALSIFRRLVAGEVSLGVERDLRNRLYGQLQRLELSFFDRQQTGQLMSRATVDLQSVRFFLGYGLIFIGQSLLSILLAAAAMFALRPELAALSLAPVLFVILIAQSYGRRSRPALQEAQQRIAELTADAEENISGVRVVKAFAQEKRQLERFRHSVGRVFDQQMTATRIQARYTPIIGFLPNLGLAVILLVGGREVIDHTLTVGEFTAFYGYLLMLISPMRTLGYMLSAAQRATASGARIFQVLDRDPQMTVPDGAPALPAGRGQVTLEGAGLTFEGTTRPALRGIDLDIPAGETVAIVGAMGSGKTALVSLLPRLYDVSAGSVKIDGTDVRDVDLRSLRQQIATVTDDPFLFSATVHENIAYGRPDATRDEVEQAARAAQAADFIERLPKGYDALIGERGMTLSGGQRQRIAIARAIVADPRVLILDDATSSVDASTEQEIKVALREVMEGRTTFVIAHRLSTIALADEIVVLEDGTVAARGTHEQLLEASPLYREIVEKGMPDQVFLNRKPVEAEVAGL
jgi:ABC-type multidrug transport system fused ATPase/permease subunit